MIDKPLVNKTIAVGGGRCFEDIEKIITKLGGKAEEHVLMNAVPLNDPRNHLKRFVMKTLITLLA